MITIRPSDSGTVYLLGGDVRMAGIANQQDLTEIQEALTDPRHTAVVSRKTFDAINTRADE